MKNRFTFQAALKIPFSVLGSNENSMKPDSLSRQAKGSASVHPLLSVSSQ
jgi:hypothetical protein